MRPFARLADALLGPEVPTAELPHPVPARVRVRRSRLIPWIGGLFMGRGSGGRRSAAAAVTLRNTILVNPAAALTDDLIVHELVHVEQWRDPLFPLKYAVQSLRHGYRENPYEAEAYARQARYVAQRPSPSDTRQP